MFCGKLNFGSPGVLGFAEFFVESVDQLSQRDGGMADDVPTCFMFFGDLVVLFLPQSWFSDVQWQMGVSPR